MKRYPGINIQFPISQLILNGTKKVETRTYPIPNGYVGAEMLIIETPGVSQAFKARIVGIIVFGKSFRYENSTEFYRDSGNHCVSAESIWRWHEETPKWGWPILSVETLPNPVPAPSRRGIKFSKAISLNL